MDFLKRQAFFLVCGLAGLGGIALIWTGTGAMPKVLAEMEGAEGLYQDLKGLKRNPVNERTIEAEEERIDAVLTDYNAVIAKARELYAGYDLLVEEVLPDGGNAAKFAFRRRYNDAMNELFASLDSTMPPTKGEIVDMEERIDQEKFEEEDLGGGPLDLGPPQTPAGVLSFAGARRDAQARASIFAAQRALCYARPHNTAELGDKMPCLSFHPYMSESLADPPYAIDVWQAQVAYWFQRDVVDAVVALNAEAAAKVERDDLWIGVMPVKELISIRVLEDRIEPMELADVDGKLGEEPSGYFAANPPGGADTVFTTSGSNDHFDVFQFTVKLIMDQRDISALLRRISANRFHTSLRVAYRAVGVSRNLRGKIYGSEPTVMVVMDFETILLDEVFGKWKPAPEEDE